MLDSVLDVLVVAIGVTVTVVTLLPLSQSYRWWIRGWDFPRLQIAVIAVIGLALAALTGGILGLVVALAMLGCLAYQMFRITPFLPWLSQDFALGPERDGDTSLMALNVEMENERRADVAEAIREENPDVLLLMETDQTWIDDLASVLEGYQTVLTVPQDDYYGMIFATRLKVHAASVERLTRDETPSVFATLEDSSGRKFDFIGLHPVPPVPGEDTVERDLQTLYAARFARKSDTPVVVMGDFNDAVWSDTSLTFKHAGEYLDVRVGRSLYPSFHARYRWFRCPIDQFYITEGIVLSRFCIGRYVGSDHFPVYARIRPDQDEAAKLTRRLPRLLDEERDVFLQQINAYRSELEKAHGCAAEANGNGRT